MRHLVSIVLFLGFVAICSAQPTTNANRGDEVLVIFNRSVPASREVADYYAKKRAVPANQVLGLDLPKEEVISRTNFIELLQNPVLRWVKESGAFTYGQRTDLGTNGRPQVTWSNVVSARIRYAVLCWGVPLKIAHDPTWKDEKASSVRGELRRTEAAVENELALLPLLDLNPSILGPLRNPLYGATNSSAFSPTNGILLVTRLDGPTPKIARELVDKALLAENHGLWGRAYIDSRGITNGEYRMGDDWMRSSANLISTLGFTTLQDTAPETFPAWYPMSHIAFYAGWYDGEVSGPFTRPEVEFMPGAVAYHLHSFSGRTVRADNQGWVGPFLSKGVTATLGSVEEPYLGGTPDVTILFGRLIYFGLTWAEAAYSSLPNLSWQTTVVGDPLYQPFGRKASELHQTLHREQNRLIEWSHERVVNLNLGKGFPLRETINYLESVPNVKKSAVLMELMADLLQKQGKPSSSIHALRTALKANPSPQQKVRLYLTLSQQLSAAKEPAEEIRTLLLFLHECPDFPEPKMVYKRLAEAARLAKRPQDAARWQKMAEQPLP